MAAGLGFKEFATGDILTAADANGYLASQVVMVFADSAARSAAITSPQQGMVTFLKGTNSTEYYSGSAWTAIGGSSGGTTLISTTTLSGSTTTISVPNTYKDIFLIVNGINCSTNSDVSIKYNSGSLGGTFNGLINNTQTYVLSSAWPNPGLGNNVTGGNTSNAWYLEVHNYNSTSWKPTQSWAGWTSASAGGYNSTNMSGFATDAAAITQLQVITSSGTFNGGTALLFGVK